MVGIVNAEQWADRRSAALDRRADDGDRVTDLPNPIVADRLNRAAIAGAIVALENCASHGWHFRGATDALAILTDSPSGRRFLHERNSA